MRHHGVVTRVYRYGHGFLALLHVKHQVEAAGADLGQLSEHDVLGDALHRIDFAVTGSLEQNVYGLLEGALHETAHLLTIDAVARDGHEIAFRGHHVAEKCQMAVVDVGAVERDDAVHLFLDGLAARLDA